MSGEHFVVFTQNHDQIGNRMNGERLGHLLDFEALKVAAGVMLLSPFLPLIFMGEEYGETSPFQYFVSHQDSQPHRSRAARTQKRIQGVRLGRRSSRSAGQRYILTLPIALGTAEVRTAISSFATSMRSFWECASDLPALTNSDMSCVEATPFENEKALLLRRWSDGDADYWRAFNFGKDAARVTTFSCHKAAGQRS